MATRSRPLQRRAYSALQARRPDAAQDAAWQQLAREGSRVESSAEETNSAWRFPAAQERRELRPMDRADSMWATWVPALSQAEEELGWVNRAKLTAAKPMRRAEVVGGSRVVSATQWDRLVVNLVQTSGEKAEAEAAGKAVDDEARERRAKGKPVRQSAVECSGLRRKAQEAMMEQGRYAARLRSLENRVASSLRNMRAPQLFEQYDVALCDADQVLGEGRQGVVRTASAMKSGDVCAVKTCDKFRNIFKKEDVGSVRNEAEVLRKLRGHPHVLQYLDCFESPVNIHLVTECCDGGDLFSFLSERDFPPMAEDVARNAVARLLSAVHACHEEGFAHLDIKLENIMLRHVSEHLDPEELVLIDFGHARALPASCSCLVPGATVPSARLKRPVGSPSYSAPEIVLECEFSERSDVWSLGVVAYVLLQGCLPFPHLQLKPWKEFTLADYSAVSNSPFRFEDDWAHLSREARDFLQRALSVDVDMRLSVDGALKHPWLAAVADSRAAAAAAAAAAEEPANAQQEQAQSPPPKEEPTRGAEPRTFFNMFKF